MILKCFRPISNDFSRPLWRLSEMLQRFHASGGVDKPYISLACACRPTYGPNLSASNLPTSRSPHDYINISFPPTSLLLHRHFSAHAKLKVDHNHHPIHQSSSERRVGNTVKYCALFGKLLPFIVALFLSSSRFLSVSCLLSVSRHLTASAFHHRSCSFPFSTRLNPSVLFLLL